MSIFEMSLSNFVLRLVAMGAIGCACFCLGMSVASVEPMTAPSFGLAGKQRALARQEAWFRWLEPSVRFVAGCIARFLTQRTKKTLEQAIVRSGYPLGLGAEEWLAFSLVLGCASLVFTGLVAGKGDSGGMWRFGAAALCAGLPILRLVGIAAERAKQLERSLPSAIDLCVLCMGAGADFPAALQFASRELGPSHSVCREELGMVLDELRLGRTRVEALGSMAERSQSTAVRDFVGAVCQSEIKGTPLVGALDIQAKTLRQRRSVLAEEAAAQAGVKLMFPLMLLMLCILLIILGPFIVQGGGMQ